MVLFVALMASNMLFRRFSAQNTDPIIVLYPLPQAQDRDRRYLLTAVEVTTCLALHRYSRMAPGHYCWRCSHHHHVVLLLGAPLLGDLCSIIGLKRYHITSNAAMYPEKLLREKEPAVMRKTLSLNLENWLFTPAADTPCTVQLPHTCNAQDGQSGIDVGARATRKAADLYPELLSFCTWRIRRSLNRYKSYGGGMQNPFLCTVCP